MFCLIALKGFSQKEEAFVEEKSSNWIKVVNDQTSAKAKTTTVKKRSNSNKSPQTNWQQEFDKTNNEVNRFKKSKKN